MNIDWKALGAKAKEVAKAAAEKASKAATDLREKADKAAEVVAAKCTEATGRETTAAEVKRAAVIVAGAVAVGTVALAVAGASGGAVGVSDSVAGGDGSWGNDFESNMAKSVAEMGGSINYYTPHVDSCGTVYSENFSW
jgi:hypothetical protein